MYTIHWPTDSTNTPAITTRPNDCADMPTIYEPDNRCTDTPATRIDKTPCWYACGINPTTTMLLRLQPEQPIVLICMRSIDQPIVPVRLRLTDRLIDKPYAWPLSLPPLVPYYHPNRLLLLPPAAKPTPCCLPAAPQAQRKDCQCRNIWTEVT